MAELIVQVVLRDRLATAVELLRHLDIYSRVPDDHGYVGSPLEQRIDAFLAEYDEQFGADE